jgi:glutamine amidotransferase
VCRLLGIASSEATEFRILLREAPRSLAALSEEHRDGWGIAVHDDDDWTLHKGTECANADARFHDLAIGSRGVLIVAHVRQKTVGATSFQNTHPFRQARWVFAHNGTVKDVAHLRANTSPARARAIDGETDSEALFAFLLTRLDEASLADRPAGAATDEVIAGAVRALRAREGIGAFNFLLSDGSVTYAHRFGRTLFLLARGPRDAVRRERPSSDGTIVETPWSQRRHALFVASERLTDEPWEEVPDGTLLRVDRSPLPRWSRLDPR